MLSIYNTPSKCHSLGHCQAVIAVTGTNGTGGVTMISEPRSLRLLLQAEGLSHVKAGKLEERGLFLKEKVLDCGQGEGHVVGRVCYLNE